MAYPTPSAYQEAVQFPATAFADPVLQAAEPRTNVLGLPQPVTGAFAAVFPLTDPATGRTWAAKCFVAEGDALDERYAALADHLAAHAPDALVPIDFQPQGIRVDGTWYPVLKMEWIDGTPLNQFVADHLETPDVLESLRRTWRRVVQSLRAARIAHGDLQHGNILVTDAGVLRLVDYDTMWVPALKQRSSAEVGHRNYQHPDRTDALFDATLDHFAARVIDVALQACRHRPALWARFDNGENMLFREADFYDPSASALFAELRTIEAVRPSVEALEHACYMPPEDVPPLESSAEPSTRWTLQAARARRRARRQPPRTGWERWLAPLALATGLAATALLVLMSPVGGLAALGGGAAVWVWLVGWRYRQQPIVRRHRRLTQEAERLRARCETLTREIDTLQSQKVDVRASIDERRADRLETVQQNALHDRLKHHFIGEARAVDGITHKIVVRLKAANIRTAAEATPKRLRDVRRIGDTTRTRLLMWRAALVHAYEDEVPDRLSPAEERRLQRYVERRIDDIERRIARAKEKKRVQSTERQKVLARREALPALSLARYVRYLFYSATLPSLEGTEHAPEAQQPTVPPPHAEEDETPWWDQPSAQPS
ncbi:protein kinase family protein [Salisaeta longa]|uniref:hypothetical protein n=1 Tax=Salisaeta longa TaxID=503170 RepID=UPI0003FEA2CD|nr:hypothetical protein [Salisaeta longa]